MNKLCLRKPKSMKNKMIVKIYTHIHTNRLNAQKNKIEHKITTLNSVYFLIIKMTNGATIY